MGDERVYRQHRFTLPPGGCDLLIVRHGESMPGTVEAPFPLWHNPETGRDHSDPPLAPEGEAQALAVAERLAPVGVDALYATPLQRTSQTVGPLAARLGLSPTVIPDLIEVHLGEWEGVTFRQKVADQDPVAMRVFAEQRWDVIPGAEPAAEMRDRLRRGITAIAAGHPDSHVVVVVHGGVIGALMAMATGSTPFAFVGADNASISQLIVTGDRWELRRFNDTTHLDPRLTLSAVLPQ